MASDQQVRGEKDASIDKALKEAKSFFTNSVATIPGVGQPGQLQLVGNAGQRQPQPPFFPKFKLELPAFTAGTIKNYQMHSIKCFDTHNYKGKFDKYMPPGTIGQHDKGNFMHVGNLVHVVEGSKAAVKYYQISDGQDSFGYILAWDNPKDPKAAKKVWVDVGPQSLIKHTSWSEIESKLDASSSDSMSHSFKWGFEASVHAKIVSGFEEYGKDDNLALVGAIIYGGMQ